MNTDSNSNTSTYTTISRMFQTRSI